MNSIPGISDHNIVLADCKLKPSIITDMIMVALPQLNCGRAPFTMTYTISSILDLLVYAVVITVYYYFLFEI